LTWLTEEPKRREKTTRPLPKDYRSRGATFFIIPFMAFVWSKGS